MPEPNEDQFVQRRLLIASVLSALAILAYSYVAQINAPPPAPPSETAAEAPETSAGSSSVETEPAGTSRPDAAAASGAEAAEPQPRQAEAEREIVVETGAAIVTFTNRGARAKSWLLKDYVDAKGEPLDLVHAEGGKEYAYPFRLLLPGGEPLPELDDALFAITAGEPRISAPATLVFEYASDGLAARKEFRFGKEGYTLEVESELLRDGAPRPHLIAWGSGFGDTAQVQDSLYSTSFYFDPAMGAPERNEAEDASSERIINSGEFLYAGIDDLFFAAVFLPLEQHSVRMETWSVQIAPTEGAEPETFAAAAIGGAERNRYRLFVGPKSIDILRGAHPQLPQIVDFGFLSILAEPLFWMLRWTYDNIVPNWGWSIVLLTVFINIVMFPLKWKGTKSMKRMQALQPLVKQINEKYKGLGMRDPRKAQQNEELMALYKKYNVNPVGGCLPLLLQMPFFFAFYKVLTVAIEMRHAEWLWVSDLSAPENLAIRILPLAMVVTQFWQQTLTPQPAVDPAQVRMMKFMPLMMGFIFYGFQSGLVLYWLTGNFVGIAQQLLLNRLPVEPLEIQQPRRPGKKKGGGKKK